MSAPEIAVFGGGCFWCTEALFQMVRGVISVMPGYAGGTTPNPTYEQVCSGTTGHAEVIRIEFDPKQVSYEQLLTLFFATHDPTTLNRQGHDVGSQYRSIILTTTAEQLNKARQMVKPPKVTQVEPLTLFYPAEIYHRNYFTNNATKPYCAAVILPKTIKMRKEFPSFLQED
jgi:methionine-S-sulfoxide reductase